MSPASPPSSQSQWAIIWRQFRKRRLAVVCAGIILALVTVSIFAPLLANDRPLFYRGVNRFEYREAARTLREVIGRLADLPADDATASTRATLVKSLLLQGRLMQSALPAELSDTCKRLIEEARTAATTTDGGPKLRELRREIQEELGRRDIPLVTQSHWPVLTSLNGLEIGFMAWNLALLTVPLWGLLLRYVPHGRGNRRQQLTMFLLLAVPVLAGTAWWWNVPTRLDRTDYKAARLSSDEGADAAPVLVETILWPPVPFGIDEDNLLQKELRPALFTETAPPANSIGSPWDTTHWLGTDSLGRDILCRMIWGGRVSLSVGIVAVAIYVSIGIVIGAIAGYFRGICDLVISRIIEVVICFPAFFLILTIVAFVGPSIFNIMVIIGLTGWTGIARLIRGEFLRLVDQEFVLAGRALGYSSTRLIFKHILPNAMAPVLVSGTFGVAGAILTESSLSFLGMGISIPTPSWGGMLSSGRDAIFRAPWLIWYPGMAVFITISCYNLVGEALRDASDPRLRGSR